MGCDYEQETCLEINWIDVNSFDNKSVTSCYVMEEYTKYKYFYVDSANVSDLEPELIINFEPIELIVDGEINSEMDFDRIASLKLFKEINTFSVCEWIKTKLLDWINLNSDLEDIIEGKYKCEFNSKIIGIKLIKRNRYLSKYYY